MINSNQNLFNAFLVKNAQFVGKYDFPKLAPTQSVPKMAIPFDKAMINQARNQWIHFYIDDIKFERIWNQPDRYIPLIKEYDGIIATDFSMYTDMPFTQQIWNTYRNRALAYYFQKNGIDVIPNIVWGLENTYEFCFDGVSKNSCVAISTNGCIRNKVDRYYFKKGLFKMIDTLEPSTIMVYGNMPNDIFQQHINNGSSFINIPNYHDTIRNRGAING